MLMLCDDSSMKPNTKTQDIQKTPPKKPSGRASITGAILAVLALLAAAIGSGLIHSKYKADKPVTTAAEKIGDQVASGTWHMLASLLGVPFLVGGIALALLAALFIVLRLRKVNVVGGAFSVVWLLICAWAVKLAVAAFQLIKAH